MTQNSKSAPACPSDVSEAQPKLPKRPTLVPQMWVLPKCFGTTHTRWWYSGGPRYTTNAIFLPLPQTYIWRRRPFYLLRCFQRALTLGRVQSTNQCAKQPHPSLTSDFSPMLFKTCYLQKQECVLKACFTWFIHSCHCCCVQGKGKKSNFSFNIFMVLQNSWKGPVSVDVTLAPSVYIITSGCRLHGADVVL